MPSMLVTLTIATKYAFVMSSPAELQQDPTGRLRIKSSDFKYSRVSARAFLVNGQEQTTAPVSSSSTWVGVLFFVFV
jgi:hypothetical protein